MESETAYSLLNVPRTASSEEILLAYRKESLKFHPQRFDSSDSFIQVHFRKLAEAYETLIDPQSRLEYDRQLILKKLKGSRKEAFNPSATISFYPPPNRPGSCAPAIETTKLHQRSTPIIPAPTRASTIGTLSGSSPPNTRADRHHLLRPSLTQAYQKLNVNPEQSILHRTRPRADSFSATLIRPHPASASAVYSPAPAAPRRFNPSSSAPSSAVSHSPHRLMTPSSPYLDQYQPLTSTLPTPKTRLASNSISSLVYQYPQYSSHRPHYR